MRNCGLINPDDVEEYLAVGGYQSLYNVLIDNRPDVVIEQIKAAKLHGRRGRRIPHRPEMGLSTPRPWRRKSIIICNADEGDPGAYMNRNEIESDPHSLLEGMLIAGFLTGADLGIIYVRADIRWPSIASNVPSSRPRNTGCWRRDSGPRL